MMNANSSNFKQEVMDLLRKNSASSTTIQAYEEMADDWEKINELF